jgi:hypothetical protein
MTSDIIYRKFILQLRVLDKIALPVPTGKPA